MDRLKKFSISMDWLKKNPIITVAMVVVLIIGVSAAFWSVQAAKSTSVGYVQVQNVLNNWPEFMKANNQFNDYATQLQNDYKDKLDKASDTEKNNLLQEIQSKLKKTNDEMVKPYDDMLNKAIESAQKAYGVDVVVTPDSVLSGGVDITSKVQEYITDHSDDLK